MDDDYKVIENIGNNEYLKTLNLSILQNSNYKNILDLWIVKISSSNYGHSCGLSDRTLLNTIFEHDNCRSIRFYYETKMITV
jgi:hypothetical protein